MNEFHGKQNWREDFNLIQTIVSLRCKFTMDSLKYGNLLEYVKHQVYPASFTKQEKAVLRRFAKKFELDPKSNLLFYLNRTKEGTVNRRLVIREDEKQKIFEECHSAAYAGHCGRDNTINKIRKRYYWPDYYKQTVEMVSSDRSSIIWLCIMLLNIC